MKVVTIISIILGIIYFSCTKQVHTEKRKLTVADAMGNYDTSGYKLAIEPRKFSFPDDHGPHPGFRTEWWYITGNLTSQSGKMFGYQFTIFRNDISTDTITSANSWSTDQVYMGHLAITDISSGRFFFKEKISRGAAGIAGAISKPLRIWIENLSLTATDTVNPTPVFSLQAKDSLLGLQLTLESLKPYVLQGDYGLSQKSAEPGNASYYFSLTRLETSGEIFLNGIEYNVSGYSWIDREWGTSALSDDQAGWDWFSIQLDDNTEIMYYQLRKKDGSIDKFSKGIIVNQDGSTYPLEFNDVNLVVTDMWRSNSGINYPSGWKLNIPQKEIYLFITPSVKNQELDLTITYWEGSVRVSGSHTGRGYAELTGY
ncbi:MAG: hypothetical protein OZ913_05685 [Ignavibacteriaceae bacterium]|nr:hypothetical protein [Ignavibacteriaceae bacterium]